MSKILTVFVALVFCADAYAAQSVKKLGTATAKSVTTAQKTASRVATSAKTVKPTAATTSSTTNADRMPAITGTKFFTATNSNKVNTSTASDAGTNPVAAAALEEALDRLDELEAQVANAITDVDVNNEGTYVTGISVSGNTLNVTRSNYLLAPVRNSSGTTTGDVEMWVSE